MKCVCVCVCGGGGRIGNNRFYMYGTLNKFNCTDEKDKFHAEAEGSKPCHLNILMGRYTQSDKGHAGQKLLTVSREQDESVLTQYLFQRRSNKYESREDLK